jgi:hypothetical protein
MSDDAKLGNGRLLARIDERTANMALRIERIEKLIADDYVTRAEFMPVRWISYGLVGTVLFAVLGAMLALVIIPAVA